MSDRPSDGMDIDELRDEFDWITEFQNRMAERIRGDADVHNLVDYVDKLEAENAKLRELVRDMAAEMRGLGVDFKRVGWCDYADRMRELGVDA